MYLNELSQGQYHNPENGHLIPFSQDDLLVYPKAVQFCVATHCAEAPTAEITPKQTKLNKTNLLIIFFPFNFYDTFYEFFITGKTHTTGYTDN